ncbi:MAG TPA: hypothetical protein PLI97_08760, partial [Fluviicola sp.]|nr:hypothetical protein [Fluviicola sp.]
QVTAIYPGSPADLAGMMLHDEIIAVNSYKLNADIDAWLSFFDHTEKRVTIVRQGRLMELVFPEMQRSYYLEYGIKPIENLTHNQKKLAEGWRS